MLELPRDARVVFFCAHPDDDSCSSSAAISGMVRRGCTVLCVYLTTSPRGVHGKMPETRKRDIRKKEALDSCGLMGSGAIFLDMDRPVLESNAENVRAVRKILKEQDAEVVFCLPGNDAHPTHSTASRIVQEAIRGTGVREVWFYETWTPLEAPNFIHFFGEEEMNAKEMAIRKHGSQVKRMDLVGAFTGLSAYRGTMGRPLMEGFGKSRMARKRYGEAFLVMRREPDKG